MRIRHATLATGAAPTETCVVVVDVLRAFTTASYALDAGAAEIVCVSTVEEAVAERHRRPGSLVMGEVEGRPIDEFDLSNSPSELASVDVSGRTLVHRTTAGTQGMVAYAHADHLFAASFLCAGATAAAVRALEPETVTIVSTGVDHRDGVEDLACADYLEALLVGETPDPEPYLARARTSDVARAFLAGDDPDFPERDVGLAMVVDGVGFSLPAQTRDGPPVIRPGWAPASIR